MSYVTATTTTSRGTAPFLVFAFSPRALGDLPDDASRYGDLRSGKLLLGAVMAQQSFSVGTFPETLTLLVSPGDKPIDILRAQLRLRMQGEISSRRHNTIAHHRRDLR